MFLPEANSYVIVIFKNGFTIGGTVEYWNTQDAKINHEDGSSLFIYKPTKNVAVVKVMAKNKIEQLPSAPPKVVDKEALPLTQPTRPHTFILDGAPVKESKRPELSEPETNLDTRTQKLAQLRAEQIKLEKEELKAKMRSFSITTPTEVNYDYPKRLGPVRSATTQTTQRSTGKSTELRNVPKQKAK